MSDNSSNNIIIRRILEMDDDGKMEMSALVAACEETDDSTRGGSGSPSKWVAILLFLSFVSSVFSVAWIGTCTLNFATVNEKDAPDHHLSKAEKEELVRYHIENFQLFQAAYRKSLKEDKQYLCLQPDPSARHYTDFASIPTILIAKDEMEQERLRGNVVPELTYGRTGNRIKEIHNQLHVTMACKKIALLLQEDFGSFFTPCYDFRRQNFTNPEMCQDVTDHVLSAQNDRKAKHREVENMYKLGSFIFHLKEEDSALDTELLRFHLGMAKGVFMAERCPVPNVPTIVMQLRGGDIFAPHPHAGYGQPPLEYYLQAVEQSGAQHVVVVSEDTKAPLYHALQQYNWKTTANITQFTIQASVDFDKALKMYMCAETVVCAQSSLCNLFGLSPNLRHVYALSSPNIVPATSNIESVWIYNISGHNYTPFQKWENSPSQIQEMLNFRGGTFQSTFSKP